jgi:hypothetical protein
MKFATRKGVRLDRSACSWLILRHIDPHAEIAFLEADDFPAAVEAGAITFHNTVSEEPNSRERTTFEELLVEFKLDERNPALMLMRDIVHGAEMKEPGSMEEAEGLRAIAKGMNALSHSDQEMVERMLPVFDALYAYCTRRVEGHRGWANAEEAWGRDPQALEMEEVGS